MSERVEVVKRAQAGDREAFAELVEAYERFCLGLAQALLGGDGDLARDVAQDAFVEAFLKLPQLRDPAAFGGWLRRIVHARADRHRRRRQPEALSEATEAGLSVEPDVEEALDAKQKRAWLGRAIESLPEHERIAVSLHYLAGVSQPETAGFLELPLTTIKKRLHSARERLKSRSMTMSSPDTTPFATPSLKPRVELFLALRLGDGARVQALLDAEPDLIDARERWSSEEAMEAGLPLAIEVSPLVLASGRGDLPLVELLLARGADVDGSSGGDTGETALWAAAESGREQVARRLLDAGARLDARNQAGLTPLHLAARRGLTELAALLLAAGADVRARDAGGRTPADWARLHGHADVLKTLGETTHEEARENRAGDTSTVETGIKALDLFAPLPRAGLVRCFGGAGLGRNVLLAELTVRLIREDWKVLWASWSDRAGELRESEALLTEIGVAERVELFCGAASETETGLDSVIARAESLAAAGPTAMFLFEEEGHAAPVEARLPILEAGDFLTLTVAPWTQSERGEALPVPERPRAPYRAQLTFDPALALRGRYPALDPRWTRGVEAKDPRQRELSLRARDLLTRLRTAPHSITRAELAAASRLEAFLTQPFLVAETRNAMPSCHVDRRELLDGVETILAGRVERPVSELLYVGALPE